MNYPLSYMFTTPEKISAPRVLFPQQELYLWYVNLDYKNFDYKILQETLNVIIGENQ